MKPEYPFCPGCSHGLMLDAFLEAIKRLGLRSTDICAVTDIGCVGLADRFLPIHTFHGLHGRTITYATGIKLTKPKLKVVGLIGDGGCGIGGHHLLNAAKRNIGICLIVFNNFNFGMTGGEHSVTTPFGGRTFTTLGGNIEQPLDLCALAITSGASFVARATAFDTNLADVLAEAISHNGFSLVDIWEICAAYYMQLNNLRKPDLLKLAESQKMAMGILHKSDRKEYTEILKDRAPKHKEEKRLLITPKYSRSLSKPLNIIIAGSAGMKIRSSAKLLAGACILCNLHVAQRDDFPITVMKGHSVSDLVISPEKINYIAVDSADIVIAVSEEGVTRLHSISPSLYKEAKFYAIEGVDLTKYNKEVVLLDIPKGVSQRNIATAAIAKFIAISRILPLEAMEKSIHIQCKGKVLDENLATYQAVVKN